MLESLTNYLYPRSPIEEEQEHIKKLQVVPSLPPPAKVDLPLKQLDYASSIGVSTAERVPQFRPQLPLPGALCSNPLPRIIHCQMETEKLTHEEVDLLETEVTAYLDRMQQLQTELQATMEAEIKTGKIENKWRTWEMILNYFTAASSLMIGTGLIVANGDVEAGACLIAAGGLSLFNQIMTDTNTWQKVAEYFTESAEKQQEITNRIQTGMFLLSIAVAVSGLSLLAQSHAFTMELPKDKEKILKVMTLATSLLKGGTKFVKGGIQKKSCNIQATLITTNAKMLEIRKTLSEISWSQQESLRHNLDSGQIVKEAINNLSQ
jgi:hypothetical protein